MWKGWGEEGHPPTSVCVKCGCFSTFRCVNLKKVCKGKFVSEAARKRVGLGKHPTGGHLLNGWRRVVCGEGSGRKGLPNGSRGSVCRDQVGLEVLRNSDELEKWPVEEGGSWDGVEGMGLWIDGGPEEEEDDPNGRGFLGFDQP